MIQKIISFGLTTEDSNYYIIRAEKQNEKNVT